MKHFLLWNTVSMAWSEVGLARDEYPEIAKELRTIYQSWEEANAVILKDILGSFSLESSLLPLALIPVIGVFLTTPFPDWGYEEAYLKKRIATWEKTPRWLHYLNPFRLLGYPVAYLLSYAIRRKLKAAFLQSLA
jgi:hypothetical protein